MKPELVLSSNGGTIHQFELPGGKRTHVRFLVSYLGSSKFCNDLEEAKSYLSAIQAIKK